MNVIAVLPSPPVALALPTRAARVGRERSRVALLTGVEGAGEVALHRAAALQPTARERLDVELDATFGRGERENLVAERQRLADGGRERQLDALRGLAARELDRHEAFVRRLRAGGLREHALAALRGLRRGFLGLGIGGGAGTARDVLRGGLFDSNT